MTKTLPIDEGRPEAWPAIVTTPWVPGNGFDPEAVWLRIECWIAYRWGERPCTFVVEGGCGSWRPPLVPFAVETIETWTAAHGRRSRSAAPARRRRASARRWPIGSAARSARPTRRPRACSRLLVAWPITPPIRKHILARRFADQQTDRDGASIAIDRAPNWTARVLANSGAADLLRPYRDLGGRHGH